MPKIEVSPISANLFRLNGLDYGKNQYQLVYNNVQTDASGNVDESVLNIGLFSRYEQKYLVQPTPLNTWKDLDDNSYITVSDLITDLETIVGFSIGSGTGGALTLQQVTENGNTTNIATTVNALFTADEVNTDEVTVGDIAKTYGENVAGTGLFYDPNFSTGKTTIPYLAIKAGDLFIIGSPQNYFRATSDRTQINGQIMTFIATTSFTLNAQTVTLRTNSDPYILLESVTGLQLKKSGVNNFVNLIYPTSNTTKSITLPDRDGTLELEPIQTTVALLPAANLFPRRRIFVTDANSTSFGTTAAGGGSNFVPVYSDGTNWRIG